MMLFPKLSQSNLSEFKQVMLLMTLFFLMSLSHKAMAAVDVYIGLDLGELSIDEVTGGNNYMDRSSFFVGHFGYTLGVRPKINIERVSLGVIGEISWLGDTYERKLNGVTSVSTIRNEFWRSIAGFHFALKAGTASSVFLEYYPTIQNTVSYSDRDTYNPFRQNDKLEGSGYSAGFLFGLSNGTAYQLQYRKLVYTDVTMSGAGVKLPTAQYSTIKVDEISVGLNMEF